jgi:hypothetical protein
MAAAIPSATAPSAAPAPAPAAKPAVTAATDASVELLHEAVAHFLPDAPASLSFLRAEGGVNNRCFFVTTSSGAS